MAGTKAEWIDLDKTKEILEGKSWEVGYTALHSQFVEFGTRPHRPPFDPIHKWVQGKLGIKGKEGQKIAWAIVNTIEQCGTKANPFFRPAIDAARRRNFNSVEEMAEFIFNESQDIIIEKKISDDGALLKSGYFRESD